MTALRYLKALADETRLRLALVVLQPAWPHCPQVLCVTPARSS